MKAVIIVLNILYFISIGFFLTWAMKYNIMNWQFWVQLIVFSLLINYHRDIHDIINNLNNKK